MKYGNMCYSVKRTQLDSLLFSPFLPFFCYQQHFPNLFCFSSLMV